jgi:large subunit ribosomal protein L24
MPGMKIRKGDRVRVMSGKSRGHEGEVMRAFPEDQKVIVDGANRARKHQRATRATMQGGIIDKDMPLPVSVVAIICKACGKPTRVAHRADDQGRKVRVCARCGGDL